MKQLFGRLLLVYVVFSHVTVLPAGKNVIVTRNSYYDASTVSSHRTRIVSKKISEDWIPTNHFTGFHPSLVLRGRGGKELNLTLSPPATATSPAMPKIVNVRYDDDGDGFSDLPNQVLTDGENALNTDSDCLCVPEYLCKTGRLEYAGIFLSSVKLKNGAVELKAEKEKNGRWSPTVIIIRDGLTPRKGGSCGVHKTCCPVDISNPTDKAEPQTFSRDDEDQIPVATPIPDDQYDPSEFTDSIESACGVRNAQGLQSRLTPLPYSADTSDFGEYPWQVALLKKVDGPIPLYLCGGTLITYEWVATAAHCVQYVRPLELLVRLGEWDVEREDELYPYVTVSVQEIVIHPYFTSRNLHNDISLLRIANFRDEIHPHITPVCLPEERQMFVGQTCWVSGWGKDTFGKEGSYQSVLKEVDVPIVSREDCEEKLRKTRLGNRFELYPGFVCAGGNEGKDACTGDGGSPLVCEDNGQWYVVGLVSWGIGCGIANVPGVYVNIQYYLQWIYSVILR